MDIGRAPGYGIYVIVWGGLVLLTGVTVAVSYLDLGVMNVVAALLIASLKATLVAVYFMHLKSEGRLVWGFALTPIVFLAIIIAGTLADTLYR